MTIATFIIICNIVTIAASLLTIFFSIKAVRNLKQLTKPPGKA